MSVGESVVMREDAVPLVPSAELEAHILEMYAVKVSWPVKRLLYIISTAFVPKRYLVSLF